MPKLRYKWWDSEAVSVKKAVIGNREYLFERANEGVGSVPPEDALFLLRNTTNYEVVQWCEACEAEPSVTVTTSDAVGVNIPETTSRSSATAAANGAVLSTQKRRGRPPKR